MATVGYVRISFCAVRSLDSCIRPFALYTVLRVPCDYMQGWGVCDLSLGHVVYIVGKRVAPHGKSRASLLKGEGRK